MEESWKDNKNWWNKITTMTEDEIETLPNEYIRKFGSFLIRYSEMQQIAHTDVNKSLGGMHEQVKNLDALETQDEKDHMQALKERAIAADSSYQYEQTGYMQRQPRLDLKKHVGNYNYEQFKEYTALYEKSKKKDSEELRQFYKMVKYSRLNKDKGDGSAMAFARKFDLDLIQIPPEFQDEPLDDIVIKKDKRTRREIIRNRSNRDLSKYDAWRCYDRQLIKGGGKQRCMRKVQLVPS